MQLEWRVVRRLGVFLAVAACVYTSENAWSANPDSSYRFEAKPGKIIGVWPDVWTSERLSQLRTRFGFNYAAVPAARSHYEAAVQAGYLPQRILLTFGYGSGPMAVDSFSAAMYYVDEAVEHNCAGQPSAGPIHSPQELAALRDYIHQHRPDALFISSGYKRCSHLRILGEYVDKIMFSSYVNWEELTTAYCYPNLSWGDSAEYPFLPIAYDQSPSWTSMKNLFGPKFTMTWIRGGADEYAILLPHANLLELNGLWVYHGEPIDTMLLLNFCNAAWRNGWMVRIAELPLSHLSSVVALRIGEGRVRVMWSTLGEREHAGYYVERRAGNETEFSILPNSFVPPRGLPGEPQEYAFVDSSAPASRIQYRLRQIDLDGTVRFSHPVEVSAVTGVQTRDPVAFQLLQNYPNPFNPGTAIRFQIPEIRSQRPEVSHVTLKVYDVLGTEVATLVTARMPPGEHTVHFDGSNLPSGVYFYTLESGGMRETKRMMLLR